MLSRLLNLFRRAPKVHTLLPYEYRWYNFEGRIIEVPIRKTKEIYIGDYLVIYLPSTDRYNKLLVTGKFSTGDYLCLKIEDMGYVEE